MRFMFALIILCALSVSSAAQQTHAPGPSAQLGEMKKLDFLVGRWKGDGWIMFGPGQRRTFTIEETVQSKLGGLVLLVEGLGRGRVDGGGAETIIHNALATIAFDEASKQFRFRAFQMEGRYVESEAKVAGNSVEWGFTDPRAGQVRFTIRLTDKGEWNETGELTRDGGKTWFKFFEMTLQRQPKP